MRTSAKTVFKEEMRDARANYRSGELERCFHHLERAHILGQRYFGTHVLTHWWMLKVGLRQRSGEEVRGQVLRLIATVPGYLFGWVPKGNTGGADVSPVKPMPLPDDLAPYLEGFVVAKDVTRRMAFWACAFGVGALWFLAG